MRPIRISIMAFTSPRPSTDNPVAPHMNQKLSRSLRKRSLLLGASLAALLAAGPAYADKIYLKGSSERVLEGVIDESRSDATRVFVRTEGGLIPIARDRIDRIEKRENISPLEREGDLAAQRGDLQQALELYLDAYEEHPEEAALEEKIANLKARIQEENDRRYRRDFEAVAQDVEARNFDQAFERLQKLLEEAPDEAARTRLREKMAEVYVEQARHLENMVAYAESEAAYRKAIETFDPGAVARFELASSLASQPAKRKEAIELYEEGLEAVARDPTLVPREDLAGHRFDFAEILARQGEHRRAAKVFALVLETDQGDRFPEAAERLTQSLMAIQNDLMEKTPENEEAKEQLELVVKHVPKHGDAHYLLGRIACDRNNWKEVVPHMETAVNQLVGTRTAVQQIVARMCLAKAFRQEGQDERALAQLQEVLNIQPTRYDALCEMGEIYLAQKNFNRAAAAYLDAIRIDEAQARAYLGAGRALRHLERYGEAAEKYRKLIELDGEKLPYLYELGQTYALLKEFDDAQRSFSRVVALAEENPKDPESKYYLGVVFTDLGLTNISQRNYYEAIENFDRALQVDANQAKAVEGKAQAYRELGEMDKAEDLFKQAIEMDPENPQFYLSLGVFYHKYQKDQDAALPYYQQYIEKGGTDPQVKGWITELGGTVPEQAA